MTETIRILIIDDDHVDCTSLQRTLQEAGVSAKCDVAHDADSGLRLYESGQYDCVFLDYRLPDQNGNEILPALTNTPRAAAVIVVTGQGTPELAVDMMESGAVEYLAKDEISPSLIERAVRCGLARREFLLAQEEQRRCEVTELQSALQANRLLLGWQEGRITAAAAGMGPIRERAPDVFAALREGYGSLLDMYLEALALGRPPPRSELNAFAFRLGDQDAGPRDLVELHIGIVAARCEDVNCRRARAYTQDGRLMALEVMGHLVDYYRLRTPQVTHPVVATESLK